MVFLDNLPLGLAAFLALLPLPLKSVEKPDKTLLQKILSIGLGSTSLLTASVLCLLLSLQFGGMSLRWQDGRVIGLIVTFAVLLAVFIAVQIRQGDQSLIPLKLLRNRTVSVCSCFTFLLSMGTFTSDTPNHRSSITVLTFYRHMYYLPYLFQTLKNMSPQETGLISCAYLSSGSLTTLAVGAAITYFGFYAPFMWVGSLIFVGGSSMFLLLKQNSSFGWLIGSQVFSGVGFGAATQIPFIAVQAVLDKEDTAAGSECRYSSPCHIY